MTVLVTYASEKGSTRQIAERIAVRLGEHGLAAQVRPVADAGDLGSYEAFVVGSAIHGGDWLPDGADFLDRNRAALARRPVWLFSVSSVGMESSAFPAPVARRMRSLMKVPKAIERVAGDVRYREHHPFAGVIEPGDWGVAGRVWMTSMRGRYGDHRNWPEIDAWAVSIAAEVNALHHHPV